jgi:hypothetical protein
VFAYSISSRDGPLSSREAPPALADCSVKVG